MKNALKILSLSAILLITLSAGSARADILAPNCKVYVHLEYPHEYSALVNRLEAQGYELTQDKSSAYFYAMNARCEESECADTEARLERYDANLAPYNNREIVRIMGFDTVQFLWSRARKANQVTRQLIQRLPTCEVAQTANSLTFVEGQDF